MTNLQLCTELRCLGFEPRPTQTGVLVSYYVPISEAQIEKVLRQVGVRARLEQVENMWHIKPDNF